MPHFIIDCSAAVLDLHAPEKIIGEVYDTADSTGLFGAGDIKVRINAYAMFTVGGKDADFIHVFGHIMQGRTTKQKKDLSERIVRTLKTMFPDVPIVSMSVVDFEKDTYCNRTMV